MNLTQRGLKRFLLCIKFLNMSIYIREAYQKIMKLYKYVGGGQFKYQLIYTFNSDMVKGVGFI